MSQTAGEALSSDVDSVEKRESKLTEKALLNKIEKLQNDRKGVVNKIKGLIPKMKELMKSNEKFSEIKQLMGTLQALCEKASYSHDELLPLLPEEETIKQNEWFLSIMKYSKTFLENTQRWINEREENSSVPLKQMAEKNENNETNVRTNTVMEIEDDIKPSDSVSNIGSQKTVFSSTSSVRLMAEAELAALTMKQKLLEEKHALEEEEERLRKRKERLQLDAEIAEKMATINILKTHSTTSRRRTSRVSDGMNSYLEKGQVKHLLNANVDEFIPLTSGKQKTSSNAENKLGAKQKTKHAAVGTEFSANNHRQQYKTPYSNPPVQYRQNTSDVNASVDLEPQSDVLGIMRKQNDITALLIQQQCLSVLPKREIPIFDGDALQYHSFIKAFENGVECNTKNNCDRLYFLEQHTRGHPKELVRSCQHINPDRGYYKAKSLLKEHYGNEQKVAAAYMDKALSWPLIKTEDVKALQNYSLFLRGCCNAMEDVQYLQGLDMPSNMLNIIKKLPYKFRDRWRSHVCELQERHQRRAKFTDIADFVEKQMRILTDPVFGNIQDSPSSPQIKGMNKPKFQSRTGNKGTSFVTTVQPVDIKPQSVKREKEINQTGRKMCICCGGGHMLEVCAQLGKMVHEKKITFLKENGICFGCLCTGHISKDCRKRISCSKCDRKHPTILHKESAPLEQTARNAQPCVDNMLVSSGLTGAGDQECKLPIVPVQVKSNKGSKVVTTYAFLDQGSTAVFCTESLMHKLHLVGRKGNILLRTMGQERVVSCNTVSGLEVAALDGTEFLELPKVYTVFQIIMQMIFISDFPK